MWRGPDDLSARFWFRRDGGTLAIRAEVTDDVITFSTTSVPHAGDALTVAFIAGGKYTRAWMTSEDGHIYEQTSPLDELGIEPGVKTLFNTQVWDNDGSLAGGR